MKLAMLLALALAACQASSNDYPPLHGGGGGGVGGGGGGGGSGSDGGIDDGGLALHGRACLLKDAADMGNSAACLSTGAGGLTVTLGAGPSTTAGTRTTTTAGDGSFTISAPMGAGFTWHVFGTTAGHVVVEQTAMPFGTDNTLPVISDDDYQALLGSNGAMVTDLQGSIFARVVRGAAAVEQVTATSSADTLVLAHYDPARPRPGVVILDWNEDPVGTGTRGVVWFPGVPLASTAPTATLVTLNQQGTRLGTDTAIVEDQTITFITVEVP